MNMDHRTDDLAELRDFVLLFWVNLSIAMFGIAWQYINVKLLAPCSKITIQCLPTPYTPTFKKLNSYKYHIDQFEDAVAPPDTFSHSNQTELMVYPATPVSTGYFPVVPQSVCQRLELMDSQQFKSYTNEQLKPSERNTVMYRERLRQRTFEVDWPHQEEILSGNTMARAGFFYAGINDCVQCPFCGGSLHNWKNEDNPSLDHFQIYQNNCPFVSGSDCGNIPHTPSSQISTNITIYEMQRDSELLRTLGITLCNKPKHPEYSAIASRKLSYNFPIDQSIVQACIVAGFFMCRRRQWLQCYHCGVQAPASLLSASELTELHARRSPDCQHLIQHKGKLFIEQTRSQTNPPDRTNTVIDRNCPALSCHFAAYPDFANADLRIQSLAALPSPSLIDENATVAASVGFFFDSSDGVVKCFYCAVDIPIGEIRGDSDLWKVHVQRSETCIFLIQNKGAAYIEEIKAETAQAASEITLPHDPTDGSAVNAENSDDSRSTELPQTSVPSSDNATTSSSEEKMKAQLTCKVCLRAPVEIIFLPCGHFVTCQSCASQLSNCPICRAEMSGKIVSSAFKGHSL